MFVSNKFLIFCFIGSINARQADIDTNRLKRLPIGVHKYDSSPPYIHGRRSINFDQVRRTNDYDDYTGGISQPHSSLHILHPTATPYPKNTVKIHQPREDPKRYYQSDAFLKEISSKNIDHEVAATYPGREVVRVAEHNTPSLLPRRRKENRIYPAHESCIRCPRDRTLISKIGSDRVMLQKPRPLVTCSGRRAPSNVNFVHMYGPKFGSYLTRGSHVIVGRITFNDETLHLCKMEVHVIFQSCPVPKYLVAHCAEHDRSCNFTCKDSRLELLGETTLLCGNDLEWESDLPICRARHWCHPPMPPKQGRISCKGNHAGGGNGLIEGSKCRVKCAPEWRPYPRGVTVCRRGGWTHNLQCQQKSRTRG